MRIKIPSKALFMEYSVILFHSTQYAIWTGKILKKSGFDYKMIPVPRRFSSDCGYCVRINQKDTNAIELLIQAAGIEYRSIEPLLS
jgi:hypothetical protein